MNRLMTIVLLLVFGTPGALAADQPRKQGAEGKKAPATEVRDWNAMDTNNDNSISPDEMKKYFESKRAEEKKAS